MGARDTAEHRRAMWQPSYQHRPRVDWCGYETAARGDQLPQSKLDADKVLYIRANPSGKTQKQLSLDFGVSLNSIYRAANFITWRHI